jgi:hypothetical protein
MQPHAVGRREDFKAWLISNSDEKVELLNPIS